VSPVKYKLGFYIPEDAILPFILPQTLLQFALSLYSFHFCWKSTKQTRSVLAAFACSRAELLRLRCPKCLDVLCLTAYGAFSRGITR
jgi:hypothetical protein